MTRQKVKQALGHVPAAAEAYQSLLADGKHPEGGYQLDRLKAEFPLWMKAARDQKTDLLGRRVFVVGYLPWWVEYSAALAATFVGLGCYVGLGFIPYRRWTNPVQAFDRRRQSTYIRNVLEPANDLLVLHDLSDPTSRQIDPELLKELEALSYSDVQYTLQREDIQGGMGDDLYQLRLERNKAAASAVLHILDETRFDVFVIPNGSILEFGAIYLAARHRGVDAVTYEFGEQRKHIWLALNDEVMRQDTSQLWKARGGAELKDSERTRLEAMFSARRSGANWGSFTRQWQSAPSQGAQKAASQLGLDLDRKVALLCTNVVGDSLALNRQVFTSGMAEWLASTVKQFGKMEGTQLIVRVHPGEMLGAGHPSTDIVASSLPEPPSHVKVVGPDSEVNTYDLIELADLGLVYTSTVGLEMAMAGIPVIVAGQTHYRGKGFTTDPLTEEDYLDSIDRTVSDSGAGLEEDQRELALRYAYRFFFEYPFPFPWHLIGFWDDIEDRPVADILASPGAYLHTFNALVGAPVNWNDKHV